MVGFIDVTRQYQLNKYFTFLYFDFLLHLIFPAIISSSPSVSYTHLSLLHVLHNILYIKKILYEIHN